MNLVVGRSKFKALKWFAKKTRVSGLILSFALAACQPLSPSEDNDSSKHAKDSDDTERPTPPGLVPPGPTPTPTPTPPIEATRTPVPPLHLEATETSIREDLVSPMCLSCHLTATSTNRYVDLTNLRALITTVSEVTPPGQPRKIIRAGCPTLSMFYLSVKNGQMPKDPTKRLTDSNVAAVEKWIISLNPDPTLVCSDEPPD